MEQKKYFCFIAKSICISLKQCNFIENNIIKSNALLLYRIGNRETFIKSSVNNFAITICGKMGSLKPEEAPCILKSCVKRPKILFVKVRVRIGSRKPREYTNHHRIWR